MGAERVHAVLPRRLWRHDECAGDTEFHDYLRPSATLFRFAGVYRMSGTATAYDIHPDGKRFIMVSEHKDAAASPRQQINIVLNWFEELRRLAPTTR